MTTFLPLLWNLNKPLQYTSTLIVLRTIIAVIVVIHSLIQEWKTFQNEMSSKFCHVRYCEDRVVNKKKMSTTQEQY